MQFTIRAYAQRFRGSYPQGWSRCDRVGDKLSRTITLWSYDRSVFGGWSGDLPVIRSFPHDRFFRSKKGYVHKYIICGQAKKSRCDGHRLWFFSLKFCYLAYLIRLITRLGIVCRVLIINQSVTTTRPREVYFIGVVFFYWLKAVLT